MLQAPQRNLKHVKPISSVLGAILIAVITFRRRHASLSREEINILAFPRPSRIFFFFCGEGAREGWSVSGVRLVILDGLLPLMSADQLGGESRDETATQADKATNKPSSLSHL